MSEIPAPFVGDSVPVIWYVMGTGDPGPAGLAVEPGAAGADIPGDVLEWAEAHGAGADPDVYLLVTTEANPGWLGGALASREGLVTTGDGGRIDRARAEGEAL